MPGLWIITGVIGAYSAYRPDLELGWLLVIALLCMAFQKLISITYKATPSEIVQKTIRTCMIPYHSLTTREIDGDISFISAFFKWDGTVLAADHGKTESEAVQNSIIQLVEKKKNGG